MSFIQSSREEWLNILRVVVAEMVKTTSELRGKISKNLQRTWACTECVPEALALLIFETETTARGEWEKSSVVMKGLSPQEKWGLLPVLIDNFTAKKYLNGFSR